MKLFILFCLFSAILAQDLVYPVDPQENVQIKKYTSVHNHIKNCNVSTITDALQTQCSTCNSEYTLASNQCNAKDITNGPVTTASGVFKHAEIGYDDKTGKCTKKVKIIDGSKGPITTDKYSGDKSCLACAQYSEEKDGEYTKCLRCVSGYLENFGGCTPMSVKPFGDDKDTTENCISGFYEGSSSTSYGTVKCQVCKGEYYIDNGRCVPPTNKGNYEEGCIKRAFTADNNQGYCLQCRDGYFLRNKVCIKALHSQQYCLKIDDSRKCTQCLPGYYVANGQCSKCNVKPVNKKLFTGDECNVLSPSRCDCNPNCEMDFTNYERCISKHCDMFNGSLVCIRCEQGYQLTSAHKCVKCENDCFTDSTKKQCLPGYYLATVEGSSEKQCRKCEKSCIECVSATECVANKMYFDTPYGHALNGLPCYDENCALCSSDDPSVCYECKDTSSVLIGGKCYPKSMEYAGAITLTSCLYYKNPDFITNKNAEVSFENKYSTELEASYIRDYTVAESGGYYCPFRDFLPYYFRKYEGENLKCAGENRDPYNDCECLPGYYPTEISKTSKCEKNTILYCEKQISESICTKCVEGMIMKNLGSTTYPVLQCGCPKENQRINHNGVCVECPSSCTTCESKVFESQGNTIYHTQCLGCKGVANRDDEELKANNYNRNTTNHCKCNDGFDSADPQADTTYSCYGIPDGCSTKGNYDRGEFSMTCNKCDKFGFSLTSGCTLCDIGFYEIRNSSGSIVECKRCHKAIEDSTFGSLNQQGTNDITYCITCDANVGIQCVDENLDPEKQCKVCKKGYSLVYRVNSGSDDQNLVNTIRSTPIPMCVSCGEDCKLDSTNGCFLSEQGDSHYDSYKQKKNNILSPYTDDEITKATHIYCDSCLSSDQEPKKDCICKKNFYLHAGECKSCDTDLGTVKFNTLHTNGSIIEHEVREVCILNDVNSQTELCKREGVPIELKCKKCKNEFRVPSSNCLKCNSSNTFPVYDPNEGHVCRGCQPKCLTCDNSVSCTSCIGIGNKGADCMSCEDGFYNDGLNTTFNQAICKACPSRCLLCNSANDCTKCKVENHIPGPNRDCKACEAGFYYDLLKDECIKINVESGFSESRPICYQNEQGVMKEIECTEANKDKIAKIDEVPVKCDTTKGVGISEYPVNGKCACDVGYLDTRSKEDIEANPIPQCTPVQKVTTDDFCIDAYFKDETKTTVVCRKCNADYLELDQEGKCRCKKTHYTTTWGMCVPCGRHNKGCVECSDKYYCNKCDDSAYNLGNEEESKDEKTGKVTVIRKCVGK